MRWLATEHEWARESPHVWVRELSRGSAGIGAPAKDAHPQILTLAADEIGQLDEDAWGQTGRQCLSQAADESLGRQAPARSNLPLVLPFAEASKKIARQTAISKECEALALRAANRDVAAMRSPRDPRSRPVQEPRHEWLGPTVPCFPLAPFSATAVGALPKVGEYFGGTDYVSAARVFPRDCDHAEHPLFGHAVRKAVQTTERGAVQRKQTFAPPLLRMDELPDRDTPWAKGGPAGQQKQTTAPPLQRLNELPDRGTPWAKGGPAGSTNTPTVAYRPWPPRCRGTCASCERRQCDLTTEHLEACVCGECFADEAQGA